MWQLFIGFAENSRRISPATDIQCVSRDNRTIIDLVTRPQMDEFIALIRKNKNYRYLELLSVLCVANGVALPENQNYIAQHWLHSYPAKGHNVLDYLAMGQEVRFS